MSTVKSKKIQLGVDATASNNFTIYQPDSPDGSVVIGQGNADSPTEVAKFNSNGLVPNVKMVDAELSTDHSGVSGWNIIPFDTITGETSWYDTTNYRFQPTVAGWYMLIGTAFLDNSTSTRLLTEFVRVGGITLVRGQDVQGTLSRTGQAVTMHYFNGITDYVYFRVWTTNAEVHKSGEGTTTFKAFLIR